VLAVVFSFSLQEWLQSKSLVVLLSLSTQEEMMLQYALLKVGYLMPLKVRIINSFIMPSEIPP
jgi:hypothetical protein